MSITTYKAEILFGGFPFEGGSEAEEFFLRLRDAVQSCGYWVQNIQLDCHFERCRISQMPEGGMFVSSKEIRVQPLDEAEKLDEEMKRMLSINENGKDQ